MLKRAPALLLTCALIVTVGVNPLNAQSESRREPTKEFGDAWITTKIQAAYFLDADVKSRNIDVATRNGVVTLTGVVGSQREREQALSIARTTDGVKDVVDKLTMRAATEPGAAGSTTGASDERSRIERLPAGDELSRLTSSDPVILSTIKAQLAIDPQVSTFAVDVDVDNGVVTLSGTVKDQPARTRAIAIANAVAGVKDVRDRLTVRP